MFNIKPFTIEKLGDGQWSVQIRARSEAAEIVPHLAAALKISEVHLLVQLAAAQGSEITQRPGAVHRTRIRRTRRHQIDGEGKPGFMEPVGWQ